MHVVFGGGQVGRTLAGELAGRGLEVRVVSRQRPAGLVATADWRQADATDAEAAVDAAKGADVVYQCLNAPYTKWPTMFPPLQANVVTGAERAGAVLVCLENVYGYGSTGGRPLTEDLPLAATTSKGRVRASMTAVLLEAHRQGRVGVAIGRASDFFGPGVTDSALGERVFANALRSGRADFLGDPGLLHTYSYVPDVARGLATLGTDARAVGEVWHLPAPAATTTTSVLDMLAAEVGRPVRTRSLPRPVLRGLGLVNPMMRELAEMLYEFEEPFVLDTAKFDTTFGPAATPMDRAVSETVAWYRNRPAAG